MRYDKEIKIITKGEEVYNEDTGDYEEAETSEQSYQVNVTHMGDETQLRLFGAVQAEAINIRFRVPPREKSPEFVMYEGKEFQVFRSREVKGKFTLECYHV